MKASKRSSRNTDFSGFCLCLFLSFLKPFLAFVESSWFCAHTSCLTSLPLNHTVQAYDNGVLILCAVLYMIAACIVIPLFFNLLFNPLLFM